MKEKDIGQTLVNQGCARARAAGPHLGSYIPATFSTYLVTVSGFRDEACGTIKPTICGGSAAPWRDALQLQVEVGHSEIELRCGARP